MGPKKESVARPKKVPEGFLSVFKGRSYTEPVCGRYAPVVLRQEINGMVGKGKPSVVETEDLKKVLGFLITKGEDTISSEHFVLGYKELGWRSRLPRQLKPQSTTDFDRKAAIQKLIKHTTPWPQADHELHTYQYSSKKQRKQGQCYSMMMEAKCHQGLFYADLKRASTLSDKVNFIKKQRESRTSKNNMKFDGYESQDEDLAYFVKKYIKNETRKLIHLPHNL